MDARVKMEGVPLLSAGYGFTVSLTVVEWLRLAWVSVALTVTV
jgi:hypothetical protein